MRGRAAVTAGLAGWLVACGSSGSAESSFDAGAPIEDTPDANGPAFGGPGPDASTPDGGQGPDGGGTATYNASLIDLTGGGTVSAIGAVPLVDTTNGKLLVVALDRTNASAAVPRLARCALDGTACTFPDISAGHATDANNRLAPVIDVANGKLVVAGGGAGQTGIYRCALDGTACAFTQIAATHLTTLTALVDSTNAKLLVVGTDSQRRPQMVRCNLDGTSCATTDISGGQQFGGASLVMSAVIDTANGKILAAGRADSGGASGIALMLFRCNLDGTGCAKSDLTAGHALPIGDSYAEPSAVIDAAGGKLLVLDRYNGYQTPVPGVVRCALDGTACSWLDVSGGVQGEPGRLVIDGIHSKLLVVGTSRFADPFKPELRRCNLDGTSCNHVALTTGKSELMQFPAGVIDATNGRLVIGATVLSSYPTIPEKSVLVLTPL